MYSQTWLESHCLQHQPLYNNTHGRNGFNGLCTKCPGYNNNLVITAHFSGTKGVVVNKFDCSRDWSIRENKIANYSQVLQLQNICPEQISAYTILINRNLVLLVK